MSTFGTTERLRRFFFNKARSDLFDAGRQAESHKEAMPIAEVSVAELSKMPELRMPFDVESLQEGSLILERYRLESVIGRGGMGVVWKAKDEKQGVDRAIKFLHGKFDSNILKNEINSCQQLTHTNIVKIFEYLEYGGTHFISMEYLDGTSLDKLIQKGMVEPKSAWKILEDVASALSHIHAMGLVHADLKPANVIVTKAGVVKLLDFGIARCEMPMGTAGLTGTDISLHPQACTVLYASKSVLSGKRSTQRDDLYSFGCVVYELLSGGLHPFGGRNARDAFLQNYKPVRIKSFNKRQWRAIQRVLSFEPRDPALSAQSFWNEINPHGQKKRKFAIYLLVLIAVLAIYQPLKQLLFPASTVDKSSASDTKLSNVQSEVHKLNIRDLLKYPDFDELWEENLNSELTALLRLDGKSVFAESAKKNAGKAFVSHIRSIIEKGHYQQANEMLGRARAWSANPAEIVDLELLIEQKAAELMMEKHDMERRRLIAKAEQNKNRFERVLGSLRNDLKCNRFLSVEELSKKIQQLEALDPVLYESEEPLILKKVSTCIAKATTENPPIGLKIKTAAEVLFERPGLFDKALPQSPDNCVTSLAGLGAKNYRSRCQDILVGGALAPVLVVIPGSGQIQPFAISRYELSVGEFNQFCIATKKCDVTDLSNISLPVILDSSQLMKEYLRWLSVYTGRIYRYAPGVALRGE
jgi:serine/threonine protein kinase